MKRYDFMSLINKEAYPIGHYIHERGGFVRFTDVEKENADRDLNFSKLMDQYMASKAELARKDAQIEELKKRLAGADEAIRFFATPDSETTKAP